LVIHLSVRSRSNDRCDLAIKYCVTQAIAESMLAFLVVVYIHVCEKKLREAVSLDQNEVEGGPTEPKLTEFSLKLVSDSCSGAQTACKYAQGHSADRIVMGSHSRSNFTEFSGGSASHEVVRIANCPETVVH
jgi:hypothetical protein